MMINISTIFQNMRVYLVYIYEGICLYVCLYNTHCVKYARIRVFSDPHFGSDLQFVKEVEQYILF